MSLKRFQLPYLTTAQRQAVVIANRDLVMDTDLHSIFVGDGITLGGIQTSAEAPDPPDPPSNQLVVKNLDTMEDYIPVAEDAGAYIRYTGALSGNTDLIPERDSLFAVGTVITFRQAGAGVLTVGAASGVTLNGPYKTAGQHTNIQIIKVANNVWDVVGGVI